MDINDHESEAFKALEYLCLLGHADPNLWFSLSSLSDDLGLSRQEGRAVFGFLVGKRLVRYIGIGFECLIPTDAGLLHVGYSVKRNRRNGYSEEDRT